MAKAQTFKLGELVSRINAPEQVGPVVAVRWNEQLEEWSYSVQFGASTTRVMESSLRLVPAYHDPWADVKDGVVSGAAYFRHALTYHRVKRPASRIAKSFSSARTNFYPHQFKPLLKFLDNPEKRILVADDVGLGKTIEAGYIMCELGAQQALDGVLLLVPSRLRRKWQEELQKRFEERFDLVTSDDIRQGIEKRRREPSYRLRWIASYETMRGLREELEKSPLSFDLIIADEAHRARNPTTSQHQVLRHLSEDAQSVVLLSATPVQNRLEDLWHLLRILSPKSFPDFPLFEGQMADNTHLLEATKRLARLDAGESAIRAVRDAVERYLQSRSGRELASSRSAQLTRDLLSRPVLSHRERVEAMSLISGLSPIASVFTRTRKAEAIPDSPKRDASWCEVALTDEERKIHDIVEQACRDRGLQRGSWVEDRSFTMIYRALASSIPAAFARFNADELDAALFEEGLEEDRPTAETFESSLRDAVRRARVYFERLGALDSKFERFYRELNALWLTDRSRGLAPRKVVVFSYFRGTVEYLRERLVSHGVSCRMIHGGIHPSDRELPIEQFLTDPSVGVLLTTDVGGEGIDLQVASALFNYDLPWNPMVVEQRIGRIDRIGQAARVMVIRNLVLKDSVEARILRRLFERIEIFEASIGEIDPILGNDESVQDFTKRALFGQVTEAEFNDIERRTKEAEARQLQDAGALDRRVDELVAADQALLDEIQAVSGDHQIPKNAHLLELINEALRRHNGGEVIPAEALSAPVTVSLQRALSEMPATLDHGDSGGAAQFMTRARNDAKMEITLSRDVAYRHARTQLIHGTHPLTRWAAAALGDPRRTFRLALDESAQLEPGGYLFCVQVLEFASTTRAFRLFAGFAPIGAQGRPICDPESSSIVIGELLASARDTAARLPEPASVDAAAARLADAMEVAVAKWSKREEDLHDLREERRIATILAGARLAHERAEARLRAFEAENRAEFAVRMAAAKAAKALERLEEARTTHVARKWIQPTSTDIAAGALFVGAGP
jgi:superfamily II DNA or RNA helicase